MNLLNQTGQANAVLPGGMSRGSISWLVAQARMVENAAAAGTIDSRDTFTPSSSPTPDFVTFARLAKRGF